MNLFDLSLKSSVTVDSPLLHVWDTFTDARSWPDWCRVCIEVWDVSDDLWRPGSKLSFRLRMANVGVPFSVVVTESDAPHRVTWESTKFSITATRTLQFVGVGARTEVTDAKRFSSPLLPIWLFYPRWVIRNMTESWLADLKAEAERRAV